MEHRRYLAIVLVLAYLAAGYFMAQYLAGAAYFLVNKTLPADIGIDTWWSYWNGYADDPVQRKRLQIAAAIGFALVFVVPLLVVGALSNRRRSLHGDARFAVASEVRRAGLNAESGIIVGKYHGRYLILGGQQFVMLAAPTRSGKGVAVVLPNLLNYSDSIACS